jgi:hypothetical protein
MSGSEEERKREEENVKGKEEGESAAQFSTRPVTFSIGESLNVEEDIFAGVNRPTFFTSTAPTTPRNGVDQTYSTSSSTFPPRAQQPVFDYASILPDYTDRELIIHSEQDTHGIATDYELYLFVDAINKSFGFDKNLYRAFLPNLLSFYVRNGASQQINPTYGFYFQGKKYKHKDILGAATRAGLPLRALLRRYADLARAILLNNPLLRSKAFQRLSLSDSYRSIAFDFADGCNSPPLSPLELNIVARLRSVIVPRYPTAPPLLNIESPNERIGGANNN